MIFHRFFDDKLAQASYLIGCVATGVRRLGSPLPDPWKESAGW